MKQLFFITICILISGCSPSVKGDAARFKTGVFEIPAGKGYEKTMLIRKDSLQIESYTTTSSDGLTTTTHVDTLFIKWHNNFSYTLRMKSPKKSIDKDPIYVQFTKVTDTSYHFKAKIGYSNFVSDGVVYKQQ